MLVLLLVILNYRQPRRSVFLAVGDFSFLILRKLVKRLIADTSRSICEQNSRRATLQRELPKRKKKYNHTSPRRKAALFFENT